MTADQEHKRVFNLQLFAVVAGSLLLLAKFAAYLLTHSNTIFTDALESIINVVAGVFALYSLYLSSKPRDFDHPYGHGKIEFISSGFEGILIALAGGLIIVKSIIAFFDNHPLEHLDMGLFIICGSGLVNFLLGFYLVKEGRKSNSLILISDGEHLKSDAYSSFGILAGILLIMVTGLGILDNIVAIVFALFIMYTGVKLIRKSIRGIMDEADTEVIQTILLLLIEHRKKEWIDIHNLRVIQYGNKLHVDCHVTLPWYYTLEEAHKAIEDISTLVNAQHASQVEFFIHQDPCVATSCKICSIENCNKRKEAFITTTDWTLENVFPNKKHGV